MLDKDIIFGNHISRR